MDYVINFPAFVLVEKIDARISNIMDLSGRKSLSIHAPACGAGRGICLPWFSSRWHAEEYLTASGLAARVVSIDIPYQAIAFLGRNVFSSVILDPAHRFDRTTMVDFVEFRAALHAMSGAHLPRRLQKQRNVPPGRAGV